jgi:hypothetical protein
MVILQSVIGCQVGFVFILYFALLKQRLYDFWMNRILFLSGSALEAQALMRFLGYEGQVVWEQQPAFAYFQPRLSMAVQAIFVVTGMEPSAAGKAVRGALAQFDQLALCLGHGFVSGLVKHSEVGDPVWAAELFYEQKRQPCLSVMAFEGDVSKTSPLWQSVLCMHKDVASVTEKAGLHASSQMDVLDALAGPWAKAIADASELDFICIRAVADGGQDASNDWMSALGGEGQSSLAKKMWHHLQHRSFRAKAPDWLAKSHELIRQCLHSVAKVDSVAHQNSAPKAPRAVS